MPRLNRLPFVLLTVTILLFLQYEKVIAQAPTAEFEANDTIVCVGNVISFTDLSIPGGSAISGWNWAFGDGGTSTQQNPTYSYSVGGNYTVQLIVTDALSNKDTITHTIYVLVAQAVQNTIRICSPQTTATIIALDPNITGVTGTWFSASGAIIASPGNDTTLISNLISGTYVFFWVVSDGVCSDADQVTVFVDQPIAANANVDQNICTVPGTTNLAGNNPSPGSGIWTTTSTATIANPSNRNTSVSGLTTPGTYTFVWTITNGACTNRDTMRITVTAPIAANAGVDQTVCASTATLAATNPTPGTGLWTTTGAASIATPSSINSSVSGLIVGNNTFIWSVSNGACITRDTVIIVVSQLINSNAGANITICTSSATATLNGNNPTPGTGLWTALNGGSITTPASATSTVTGLITAGTYNFVWTITNGACVSRDTVAVIVNSPVVANAGADQNICNIRVATLTGNAPAPGTGSWSTTGSATIASPASATTGVSNLAIGNNTFVYTITLGTCISRDTIIVRVDSLVAANAGPDQQICETTTTITLAGNTATPGTGTWTSLNGGTITTPASPTSTVTGLTPGQHQFVWTITNGTCTSRDTMRVTVNVQIPANAGLDQQICQGTTTSISGNNPSPATGLWTTTSTATIVSPSSATSAVNGFGTPGIYNFIWTVTNGACVQRDTVRITVNATVIANAGPDQSICTATTATLAGNSAAPGSGVWTSIGSATVTTPSSATSGVTGLTTGNNQFVWTITNGACISRDTVNIRVDILVASNAGVNQSICLGTAVTLTGNAPTPGTGLWTALNGGTITAPANATTNVTGITVAGSYNFVWTITNGSCVSRDTVLVTISATVIANAGPDQSICSATTATLAGNNAAPGSGIWTSLGSAIVTTPSSATSGVTGLTTGNNQFVWTITNGACITRDTVNIRIDIPITSNAGVNQSICLGTAITLTGNAPTPGTGLWTALNGGTITTPTTATTNVTGITVAGSNNFVWTITNGTCVSRDTVQITVSNQIAADAGPDASYCALTTIFLDATDVTPAIGTWTALSGGQILDVNDPNTIVNNLNEGFYQFVWEVANGACITRDTVSITIDTLFVADAGVDQQICQGDITTLNGSAPLFGSVLWTALNGGTIVDPGNTITQVTDLDNAGTYSFVWTITNGSCTSTDTVDVVVDSLVIADAGKDQELCEIFDTNLEAGIVAIGIGTWSTNGTGVIDDVNDPLSLVTGLSYGDNEFIWTMENNNCSSTDIVIIHVDSLIVADAGIDQQICSTTSQVTLAGNSAGAGIGQWLSADGFTFADANDPITTVAGFTNAGTYFIEWEITNGACVSLGTLVLIVDSNEIANAGADQTLCDLFDATLSADAATIGIGTWSTNGSAIINDINDPNTTLTTLSYGDNEFVWTIVNNTCSTSDTIIIHVDSLIVADAGIDQQICSTTSQVTLSANSAGSGTGQWFSADGFTFADVNDPNTTVTGFVNAGTYFIEWEITNGLCTSLDTLVLIVDSNEVANAGADQSLCDLFDATLSADAATIGIGTWSTTGSAIINDINDPNTTLTSLSYGDNEFVWTIVNNSCETSDTIIIHVDSLIVADAGIDQQICSTTSQVTLSGNSAGAGTGQWFSADGFTFADVNDPNTTVTGFVNAGTYFIEWEITNGVCTSLDSLVLIVDSNVVADAGTDQALCETQDSTSLNATAVTVGTGNWSSTSSSIITDVTDPNTSVTGLTVGTHDFIWTVTNNSCVSIDTVTVIVSALASPAFAGLPQQACASNNSVALAANAPSVGVGQWSTLTGATITDVNDPNSTVTNLTIGLNTFVWTVTNGACSSTDTTFIGVTPNPVADAGIDQFVTNGVSVVIGGTPSGSGGIPPLVFSWSPATFLDDSLLANPTATVTNTQQYILTVADSFGCVGSDTMVVYLNNPPIANTDSLVIDEDSTVVIAILDNDTDLDSNIDSTSIQVSINPTSGSVTINTTTGTITYVPNANFFGSDSLQYVICDTGLPVYCDTAWVYITVNPVNDAPIAVDDSVTTVEDSCIQIIVLANDSDVENGIVVSSLGTLTSPNNGTITLDTLTGVYTYCPDTNFIGIDTLVYIICDNGTPALCDTAVVIITVNSKNDAPIAADDNVTLCSSDSVVIDVLANDIEPDNDTLSISIIQIPLNGNAYIDTNLTIVYQPTISVNGLDSIQYVVCDNQTPSLCDTAWAYIFINATPNIVLTTSDSKCFGDSVGSITSVVTGNSPFVYSWSNADTLSSIDSLVAGVYTLMVMDSLGCTASATDTVNGPANALAATVSLQNVLCFGDSTGAIDLQVNGGTSPYTYSWSTADTTEDLDSLPIGIYTVTILDSNLCQLIVVDSISQPDSALIASLTVTDILCGGDSTGSATVVVTGGTPGYTYAWSTSDTISNLSNLYSGIYAVTITDAFSCAVVLTDTINDLNTQLVSTINAINPQCLAGVQGQINLQISGGVLPYIYNWNNGDSTAVLDSLSSGLYTVTVIDSNNCQVIDSVSLVDSSVYVLSTTDSVLCQGDTTVLFATGYADLVYNWYADGVLLPDTIAGIIVSQTGSYNVTSTNVCGVYSSDTINVIVNALPTATITGPSATVCDSAIVLSGSGGNTYSWNPAQACTTPDQPSTSILLANSTTVILNIVDTNGCTSSDSLFVTVTCDSLNIPSGFSPNGDGVNDYFYIENIERYPNAVLKVFNRWGNLVYEKKNYDNSWNGDSNSKIITIGEVLTNGTYFYVLDLANDEDPIQGYIILRR